MARRPDHEVVGVVHGTGGNTRVRLKEWVGV